MAKNDEMIDVISPAVKAELKAVNAEILTMVSNIDLINTKFGKLKTPSQSDNAVKELNAQLEKQGKLVTELQTKLNAAAAKQQANVDKTRLGEINLQRQREKAFDNYEKSLIKEQQLLAKSESIYFKVDQKVKQLSATYNDIAIKKELGIKLSVKEEAQLDSLNTRLNKYQSVLKNVDASIQKNQRAVGSYAGAYNGLGNSINQITRELPAFTFSAQTGFLALSNNIPILTDEIGRLVATNKELAKQGQPVKSVLSQILGSVLSLQTVMGIAILGFTLYGKEISNFATNLFKSAKGIDEFKQEVELLDKAFEDSSVQKAITEVDELRINIGLAKDGFIDKKKVVEQYNETIGKTTGFVKTLDEAEQQLTKNGDAYIRMTLYKAAANLALNEAAKSTVEAERNRLKKLEEFENKFLDAQVTTIRSREQYERTQKQIEKNRKARQEEEVKFNESNAQKNINIAKRFQQQAAQIAKNFHFNLFGDNKKEDAAKQVKELAQTMTNSEVAFERNIAALKKQAENVDKTSDTYRTLIGLIKLLEEVQKTIGKDPFISFPKPDLPTDIETPSIDTPLDKDSMQWLKDYRAELKLTEEETARLKKATDEFVKSFTEGFFDDAGLPAIFDILDGRLDDFGDNWQAKFELITEAAQQAFNFINEKSQQGFEAEKSRLEAEKNIAIQFAGESDAAKKEIERQYEIRKRAIERRELAAQKKIAIFNIAINAAQGIVAAFSDGNIIKGAIFAAAIAAIAAFQISAVNSQQIPQYFKGTDNAPGGLAWTNEKGAEIHTDSKGNIKDFGDKKGARLVKTEKGDKIYTAEQSRQLMFNKDLNSLLASNGVSGAAANVGSAFPINEFRSVGNQIANSVANMPQTVVTLQNGDFKRTQIINGSRIQSMNNRANHTGLINP